MNPRKTKALIMSITGVAVLSLATNLFLIRQLHQTDKQATKWKKAHERLTHRYLFLENQNDRQAGSRVDKQTFFDETTNELQSADAPGHLSHSSNFTAKPQNPETESTEQTNEFFREEIQDMLADALAEEFPELELDETELVVLTDAVITIRESLQTLRTLERTGENAEIFKETQVQRDQAMADFERITGMNAVQFMLRAPTEGGIDRD